MKSKKLLSLVLALVLCVGVLPGINLTAMAADDPPSITVTPAETIIRPNSITELHISASMPWDQDARIKVTASFENGASENLSDYVLFSTDPDFASFSATTEPVVTIKGGHTTPDQRLYVFARRSDENTIGEGNRILFTPMADPQADNVEDMRSFFQIMNAGGANIQLEAPVVKYPTASDVLLDNALSTSTLTGGEASVPGNFEWKDDTKVFDTRGNWLNTVVFTPNDTINYNTVEFNVIVKVYRPPCTITFDTNGAILADDIPASADTDEWGKLTSLPTPVKTGCEFKGWYDSLIGGKKVTTDTVFDDDAVIYAQWHLEPKQIMLGTSGISPWNSTDGYDYIYMGNYNSSPIKWRVLDNVTNMNTAGLFLLSEELIETTAFQQYTHYHEDVAGHLYYKGETHSDDCENVFANVWHGSDAQAWCTNFMNGEAFSDVERSAIMATSKNDNAPSNGSFEASSLNNDKMFFLSEEEASSTAYGFNGTDNIDSNRAANNNWWLRSPDVTYHNGNSAFVQSDGYIACDSVDVFDFYARPAFNLNSVQLTSAATGGKAVDTLTAPADYMGNEWKLTLLDSDRAFTANTSSETTAIEGYSDWEIDLTYSNASIGTNEYVSAMIVDAIGNVLYYGQIANNSANGNTELTIPSGLAAGNYKLKVFSEQLNGDKKTDYASAFKDIALTVTAHTHSWDYSGSGAKITASCVGTGTCDYAGTDKELIISAPAKTTYADANSANATLSGATLAGQITLPTIKYVGRDNTTYAESETAPTNAGKYTAKITVETSTASVDYEIAKATPTYTAPTGLTATYGQTLANVTLPTGFTWQDVTTTSVGNAGTNTFKATFTPTDIVNYETVADIDVNIEVSKATPIIETPPTAPRIAVGSKLEASVLSGGVASVDGTFDWETPTEEMTTVENATRKVIFTPTDTTNYTTAECDVTVEVYRQSSGGGGGVTRYTVKFDTDEGSTIKSVTVTRNNKVTEPTEPTKAGFVFDGWYTDKELTEKYDFASKVTKSFTLYAKWNIDEEQTQPVDPTEWQNPFNDVKENDWYYDNVKFAYENGLMKGTSETEFAPNLELTRGMFVTILYGLEGEPAVNRSIHFADVKATDYFANAVIWAQQNEIVSGVSETEFAPNANITREQMATILYRYAKAKGYDVSVGEDTNILSYTDFDKISEYAIEALQYTCGAGLIKGRTESTLNPQDNATRAETAAILQRFIEGNVK